MVTIAPITAEGSEMCQLHAYVYFRAREGTFKI